MNKNKQDASALTGVPANTGNPMQAGDGADDSALVERSLAGDATAFEALFTKYRQRVFAAAWRLLRDEDAALDVVQEAFVKAYEQLEHLRGETRFFPWLRRIAVNLAIDRLRHNKRSPEVSLNQSARGGDDEEGDERGALIAAKDVDDGPSGRAQLSEFNAALAAALQKLSDPHRTVFMLHATEGMSYKEIADMLDCNIGTVMSRLFYARKKLQELLGPHLKEEM